MAAAQFSNRQGGLFLPSPPRRHLFEVGQVSTWWRRQNPPNHPGRCYRYHLRCCRATDSPRYRLCFCLLPLHAGWNLLKIVNYANTIIEFVKKTFEAFSICNINISQKHTKNRHRSKTRKIIELFDAPTQGRTPGWTRRGRPFRTGWGSPPADRWIPLGRSTGWTGPLNKEIGTVFITTKNKPSFWLEIFIYLPGMELFNFLPGKERLIYCTYLERNDSPFFMERSSSTWKGILHILYLPGTARSLHKTYLEFNASSIYQEGHAWPFCLERNSSSIYLEWNASSIYLDWKLCLSTWNEMLRLSTWNGMLRLSTWNEMLRLSTWNEKLRLSTWNGMLCLSTWNEMQFVYLIGIKSFIYLPGMACSGGGSGGATSSSW